MTILLLGGTSDAVQLGKQLITLNIKIIYSIAGLVRQPELDCIIHSGGFQGELPKYLQNQQIDLLLDATHPYATHISQQAKQAAQAIGIDYWVYTRPAWQKQIGDDWVEFKYWDDLLPILHSYKAPFFTLGREPLQHLDDIRETQYWTIRTAIKQTVTHPNMRIITAIGGFSLQEEFELFSQYGFDVLVCKNSGGDAVAKKLSVARKLSIPIFMQARPEPIKAHKSFTVLSKLICKVEELQQSIPRL